jgi:hypothetical protein
MKKTLVLGMAMLVSTVLTYAQGTLNFANFSAGVDARVLPAPGGSQAALVGSAYNADLYFGPAGITDPLSSSLNPLGVAIAFQTAGGGGYFLGGTQTVPGFTPGTEITVQVRVWQSAAGGSYSAALANSGAFTGTDGHFGYSQPIQITLGGGTIPNPNMVGLVGFPMQLSVIPEPSTFVLAGLGVASLLLFRRRK